MQKKSLIILICKILETETDSEHPMSQTKIADIISDVYWCDRKTVSRNIKVLREIGYPIVKTSKGFYMSQKVFSLEEIEFVKEAVNLSPNHTDIEKAALLEKLLPVLQKIYKR